MKNQKTEFSVFLFLYALDGKKIPPHLIFYRFCLHFQSFDILWLNFKWFEKAYCKLLLPFMFFLFDFFFCLILLFPSWLQRPEFKYSHRIGHVVDLRVGQHGLLCSVNTAAAGTGREHVAQTRVTLGI